MTSRKKKAILYNLISIKGRIKCLLENYEKVKKQNNSTGSGLIGNGLTYTWG